MTKKIFITGVGSGIGHSLAKHYLDQQFEVYGISRHKPDDLNNYPNFAFQALDLEHVEQIRSTVAGLVEGNHDLDLVILNAAIPGKIGDNPELALADYTQVMTVNVWANKVLLDSLFSVGLTIRQVVAISSHAGIAAFRGHGPYCVSKAALNMLISMYATEKPQTHFSVLAPPLVDTGMQRYVTGITDDRFSSVKTLREARKRGLMLSPHDAAQFLSRYFDTARKERSGSFIDAAIFNQTPPQSGFADGIRKTIRDMGLLLTSSGR